MKYADMQAALPDGHRVYAIGDIHGRVDCLQHLLQKIAAHIQDYPILHSTVVFLGDYIDKGLDSKAVVEALLHLPFSVETIFLMGNHEYALLQFMEGGFPYEAWLNYGGEATLLSYGVKACSTDASPEEVDRVRRELVARLPQAHADFFAKLRLIYQAGDYVFVHAGIRPGIALENQQPEDLLMIRGDFLCEPVQIMRTIIHGHTPSKKPFIRKKSIGIDTGAYQTGVLTAIVLEKTTYAFLHS